MDVREFTCGDIGVSLYATLQDGAGSAIDLTDQTVTFTMESVLSPGTNKVDGEAAAIVSAALGTVRYDWKANDVNTAGVYWGYFIRHSALGKATHPVGKQFQIVFRDMP